MLRITAYNQSARQISVDGEANTAALAYQFIDKVKKSPELRIFQFEMAAPAFCRTIMHSFDWREDRDDSGLV